jgi:hypothetical protein
MTNDRNKHTSGADAPPWLDLPQQDPPMPVWQREAFLRHAQGKPQQSITF